MVSRQTKRWIKVILGAALVTLAGTFLVQQWLNQGKSDSQPLYDFDGNPNMQAIAKAAARKRQATNSQSIPEKIREDVNDYDSILIESDAGDPIQRKAEAIIENAERYIQARKDPKPEPVRANTDELVEKLESLLSVVKESQSKIDALSTIVELMSKRVANQEDSTIEMESLFKSRLNFLAEKQQEILRETNQITRKHEVPFLSIRKFDQPPVSTVTCFGNSTVDRVCKVKNLCYDPDTDNFFIFKDIASLELNTPKNRSYLVDMTSIDGHNRFYFDYQEVHPDRYEQRSFRLVEKLTFIVSRFHTYNIMHTVHDDFIGLYMLHRMFAPNTDPEVSFSFSMDNNIFFADSWSNLRYDYIFQLLSSNQLQFRESFKTDPKDRLPICFRDAVLGNSKLGSWYSYGFLEPQGPIPNKKVSGLLIREVASYLIRRFHLPLWNENSIRGILGDLKVIIEGRRKNGGRRDSLFKNLSDHHYITIFSRKFDRLILNEDELAKELQRNYGLEVKFVRIEDMHLLEQISILKNTVVAMGMHGSALILSMFLPPGALLVEFFPYRVPAENYTPYKTLCGLPGIRLAYRAWSNTHPENSVAHPEKAPSHGGIKHLSEEEQLYIINNTTVPPHLCCSDPNWLYRIYQDTKVDLGELFDLIDEGVLDGFNQINTDPADFVFVRPASVENVYCKVGLNGDNPEQLDLTVTWTKPWNGVRPAYYGLWVHQAYTEYNSNSTEYTLRNCTAGKEYDIWVRPYSVDGITGLAYKGGYSDKFSCSCSLDSKAVKKPRTHKDL